MSWKKYSPKHRSRQITLTLNSKEEGIQYRLRRTLSKQRKKGLVSKTSKKSRSSTLMRTISSKMTCSYLKGNQEEPALHLVFTTKSTIKSLRTRRTSWISRVSSKIETGQQHKCSPSKFLIKYWSVSLRSRNSRSKKSTMHCLAKIQ